MRPSHADMVEQLKTYRDIATRRQETLLPNKHNTNVMRLQYRRRLKFPQPNPQEGCCFHPCTPAYQ